MADQIGRKLPGPWEVFAQNVRRYEIHLVGQRIELLRGPLSVEGFGVRVFRPREGGLGVGLGATNDISPAAIERAAATAEAVAKFAFFPAPSITLPGAGKVRSGLDCVDSGLRDHPEESLQRFSEELLAGFEGRKDPVPSFGSVRASFVENSLCNSEGERVRWEGTTVAFEMAVKSVADGQSGSPSEFWVNSASRRLEAKALGIDIPRWARLAQDMQGAKPPSSGSQTVVFPPDVLAEIIPAILGFRLTGAARLRNLAPELGSKVGGPLLHLSDEPFLPWGVRTSPLDDEGSGHEAMPLIESGVAKALAYDLLHGAKFETPSTGHGMRQPTLGEPYRFSVGVGPATTNLVVAPGDGGSEEEMMEAVGEGIWLEQLGFPFPDGLGGSYGGELRVAYRIHRGRRAEPLRGGTVGGLLIAPSGAPSLLAGISGLGSKSQLCGSFSSPHLAVEKIAVAGPT
ncbi:MAG: TldD/PmbA family protein [Thermoplasmata archaeon]|nr:TldD/PmbA family protein [Thermoplasmata archaeon]